MRGLMALPSNVTFVTFDVYGTLIDWETGIADAFEKEASRDGFTIDRDEVITLFLEISREIESGSYELYAEVLRRTAIEIAKRIGWDLEPSRSGFLPDSVQRWRPFKETNAQLAKFKKSYDVGLISQHRRQAARSDAPAHPARLRPRRHRPAGPLLQAGPGALQGVRAPHRRQEGLGPRRLVALPRRRAVPEGEDPGRLGQPAQGDAGARRQEADRRGQDARARRSSSSAAGEGLRAPAPGRARRHQPDLADDVHRRCAAGDEAFVVDSPVLPDELDVLPAIARAGRLPVLRAAGHARRLGPPAGPLRVPRRVAGLRGDDRGAADGRARRRPARAARVRRRPLRRARRAALARPGRGPAGARQARARRRGESSSCTRPTGTPPTAWRSGCRGRGVLVCGDYLSPVEIPWLSRRAARATPTWRRCARLRAAGRQAEWVVPGHGEALDGARATAILREDRAYLEALGGPDEAALPLARRTATQRRIHEENRRRVA